ncbi:peptidase S41, partial [Campylobacter jejuni]|nr:peptidase S41 [Campylobacter jejuni]MCW1590743.1 peptidase S41 [Campylobacter jejuni]
KNKKEDKQENKDNKNLISQKQINDDAQLKSAIDTIKILNIKQGQ